MRKADRESRRRKLERERRAKKWSKEVENVELGSRQKNAGGSEEKVKREVEKENGM